MANEVQLKILGRGVRAWNEWRRANVEVSPDLSGANLSDADLSGANLSDANLRETKLEHAHLSGANFIGADLLMAHLSWADLRRSILTRANLDGAFLNGARLNGADLRMARMLKAQLDGATLTDARLSQTLRNGWSIKGVICERVLWDEEGTEPTDYDPGEFEQLHAEGPRIELRYEGGVEPIVFTTLPFLVEHLTGMYEGCRLRLDSIQQVPGAAKVTIVVDEAGDRDPKEFEHELTEKARRIQEVQVLLAKRLTLQRELDDLKDRFFALVTKVIEQPTAPIQLLVGEMRMGDEYSFKGGQFGAVGRSAQASHFQQVWRQSGLDGDQLADDLAKLRSQLRERASEIHHDVAIGEVATAEKAAKSGDGMTALKHLKRAGQWALDTATDIGTEVAAAAIKASLGLP
jgi:uncharacterized protein YjbI with pentapeptide repeats